jgi:ATP/maltotriose-dependent transcriptional regulator MalT
VTLADELHVQDDLLLGRYGLVLQWAEVGDLAAARAELDRAATAPTTSPEMRRFVLAVGEADLARMAGDPAVAVRAYHDALALQPRVGGIPAEVRPVILLNLARAVLATGDVAEARRHADEVRRGADNRLVVASLAEVDAAIALAEGAPDRAAHLLGCAEAARGIANLGSRAVVETAAAARSALGQEKYDREYATGAAYSLDETCTVLGTQVLRR